MNASDQHESEDKPSAGNPKPRELHSHTKPDLSSGDLPTDGGIVRHSAASSSAPASLALGAGSMLGPYELLETVGQGGMGTVYKARHTRLKKIVALKVLAPSLIGNEEAQARFDREMEAVGKIDHPNIVRALDAGEFGGLHYLSMEYVEGTDLNQLVRERGPLSVANACQVIRQAAQGLAVAHEAGLVHRDIKPANILLANDGRVKLLDLGLARIGESDTKNQFTGSGQTFGTADYMAPEQCEDSHKVDARADLYSLGCTLYFLLTGKPPYAGAQSFPAKILAHVSAPIPDLSSACPEAPAELVSIYQKLMAKSAAERIVSAWEIVSLLTPLAGETAPADLVQIPLAERPKRTTKRAIPFAAWFLAGASIAIAIFSIVILTRQVGTKPDVRHDDRGGATDTNTSSDSPPVDLPTIDYAAERKVAEWLAERMSSGFIKVEVGSGEWIHVDPAHRQLPGEQFTLRQVQGIPEVDDEGLALLAECRRVTYVTLVSNPNLSLVPLLTFTDSAAPTLAILNLQTSPEIQEHLVTLLSRKPFPALQQVSASDMRDGYAFEHCPKLPSLEILDLPGSPIGDKGLKAICERYPKLKSLGIPYGLNVSAEDLRPLAELKNFRRLVSSSPQWSDRNLAVLKSLPQFEALAASSPVAKPPGSLQKLSLLADKLVEFELFVLADWDPGPSDDDYETILQFRKLTFLRLEGHTGSPTDDHLAKIAKLPALKKFHLSFKEGNRRYTAGGIAAFREARPDVEMDVDGEVYPAQAN